MAMADDQNRSDLEQLVESRAGDAAKAGKPSPLEPAGAEDGVGGTAGVVKNQDKAAQ
jgi:hypothetical protein